MNGCVGLQASVDVLWLQRSQSFLLGIEPRIFQPVAYDYSFATRY